LWGNEILSATRRGLENPLVKREQAKRPSDALLRRLEKLKAWRKKLAAEIQVESDIILPKLYLGLLSEKPPQSMQDLETIMRDSPARFKRFGADLYHLIGG
jgi:superfamily II DNA helicase RecQ